MEEIDLDKVEYVIGYKDTAGIQNGVRMRLHIWRMDGIGIRSGTRVGRRLETG